MPTDVAAPILATQEQRVIEAKALAVVAAPPMQAMLERTRALLAADELGKTEAGAATVDRAANALAMSAALYAANDDAERPAIIWGTAARHEWMGLSVPSSGYGLDNPDNVYRSVQIDGGARYEITGSYNGHQPAQQTMVMFTAIPGITQVMNAQGHMKETAGLRSDTLKIEPDGSFRITIDSDPANGRPNHMQTDPDARGLHLLIRDSLSDWNKEWPATLSIRRVDGVTPRPPRDEAALIARATEILGKMGPYWRDWIKSHVHARPVNEVVQPWARLTGWGFTQTGSFHLKEGEAWVVTLGRLEARYFNFQLGDPWGIALEYVARLGSLNGHQAKPNADGSYTFVVADRDPGVYNWLDTGGLRAGTFQIRWQSLPAHIQSSDGAVLGARVVPLSQLRDALPEGTHFQSAQERADQIAERARSYATRLR